MEGLIAGRSAFAVAAPQVLACVDNSNRLSLVRAVGSLGSFVRSESRFSLDGDLGIGERAGVVCYHVVGVQDAREGLAL